MAAISLVLSQTSISPQYLAVVNTFVVILFMALPVLALYRAADHNWRWPLALSFVILGAVIQVGGTILARKIGVGLGAAALGAFSQSGLMIWCLGLGALLTSLLKEKNLVIPVAVFLAAFDLFLVFSPIGVTNQILKARPDAFQSMAYVVPKALSNPTYGPVSPGAYVGPADLLFIAMFFVAIYRFHLRAKQTLLWLIPAVAIYMFLVGAFGIPLPAMVPIGLTVFIVNFKEFKLAKEEWQATIGLAVLMLALLGGSLMLKPRVAPSTEEPEIVDVGSGGSLEPERTGQPQSPPQNAPENTQDPQ